MDIFKSSFALDSYDTFPQNFAQLANGWSTLGRGISIETFGTLSKIFALMSEEIDKNHSVGNVRQKFSRKAIKYLCKPPSPTIQTMTSMPSSLGPSSHRESFSNSQLDDTLDPKREKLLAAIRELLMRDKEYYLAEKAGRSKADQVSDNYDPVVFDSLFSEPLDTYSDNQWWELVSKSKPVSQALQRYIEVVPTPPAHLEAFCLRHLVDLVVNNLGNYVIQKVVPRSHQLLEAVVNHCSLNFWQLLQDEYASRVMQLLVGLSDDFRATVLSNFRKDHEAFFRSVAGVFLASVSIKSAKSDLEYEFVIDLLCRAPSQLAACRYSCRALVSVVEVCSPETLDKLVGRLNLDQGIERYLGDKFASYMMVGLLLRNHGKAVNSLVNAIQGNVRKLFECKCWKLFAVRLFKRNNPEVMVKIYHSLTSIDESHLASLKRRTDYRLLYWAAVLACSQSLPQGSAALALQTVELAVSSDLEHKKPFSKNGFAEIHGVRQFNSLRSV